MCIRFIFASMCSTVYKRHFRNEYRRLKCSIVRRPCFVRTDKLVFYTNVYISITVRRKRKKYRTTNTSTSMFSQPLLNNIRVLTNDTDNVMLPCTNVPNITPLPWRAASSDDRCWPTTTVTRNEAKNDTATNMVLKFSSENNTYRLFDRFFFFFIIILTRPGQDGTPK